MNTRTWAEIDEDALKYNIEQIRKKTNPNAQVMAIVKSDAYGHGVIEASKIFLENGADQLGVACFDEAMQIRRVNSEVPILIIGASFDEEIEGIVKNDITPAVFSKDFAEKLSLEAQKQSKICKIHIKLDTGMTRIGYNTGVCDDEITDEIIEISKMEGIEIEGIFSHFSTADEKISDYTYEQFGRFMNVCEMLLNKGLEIPIRHIANSAAIMMYPEMHLDMVRAGIILYGFYPSDEVDKSVLPLKKAMSLKSRITRINNAVENRGVSYGKTYITEKNMKLATVPVGYADGYTRMLSGKAKMEVNNQVVDVVGRICMDQCMINVTNVNNITTGDEVTIFGTDTVTADNLAKALNTINYEIVCMVAKRIPRVYLKNGRTVKTLNYLNSL